MGAAAATTLEEALQVPPTAGTGQTPFTGAPPTAGMQYSPRGPATAPVMSMSLPPTAGPPSSAGAVAYTSLTPEDLRPRIVPTVPTASSSQERTPRYPVQGSLPTAPGGYPAACQISGQATRPISSSCACITADAGSRRDDTQALHRGTERSSLSRLPATADTIPVVTEAADVQAPPSRKVLRDAFVTEAVLQSRLEALVASVNGSIQQALEQVIEATNVISTACEDRFVALEKDVAARHVAVETLANDFDARQTREDLWHSERAGVLSDIAALRNETSQLRRKAEQQPSQASAQEAVESLSGNLLHTEKMVMSLKQDMETMQRSWKGEVDLVLEEFRRELERCKDPRVWADLESLRAKCEGLSADFMEVRRKSHIEEMLLRDLENLQEIQQEMQQKINDIRRDGLYEKTQADASLAELRHDLGALQPRLDVLEKDVQRKLEGVGNTSDDRRRELDVLQADYQRRLARNESDTASNSSALNQLRSESQRISSKVSDLQKGWEAHNAKFQEFDMDLRELQRRQASPSQLLSPFTADSPPTTGRTRDVMQSHPIGSMLASSPMATLETLVDCGPGTDTEEGGRGGSLCTFGNCPSPIPEQEEG
mmetsp:Transcript_63166/g.150607  ORF Transcript_63166/g.150607 Transcript_63166/m.150607 type:complete len:601 (+) Transcript_63166:114-1916(+)